MNKRNLMEALEKVAIEVVNMVGIDFCNRSSSSSLTNQIPFICGLGPRKAFNLLEKIKSEHILYRESLLRFVSGKYVYQNCSPFFRI